MSLTDAPRIIASRTSSSFWGPTAPISEPTSRTIAIAGSGENGPYVINGCLWDEHHLGRGTPFQERLPRAEQLDLSGRLTVKPNLSGRGRPAVESVVGREGIPNPSTAKGGSRGALHGNDAEQPVLPSLCDELLDHV